MAGIVHKIEEALHLGGHKKEEEQKPEGHGLDHHKPEEHKPEGHDHKPELCVEDHKKEGLVEKIKDKIPGGDHGDKAEKKQKKDKKKREDGHEHEHGHSSSSSDSDSD